MKVEVTYNMSVSVVIGGQYGSEGKGKVAYYWANKMKATAVVRVGGSNSGHTIYDETGKRYALRMLPTVSVSEGMIAVLPAGSYIDVSVLMEELKITHLPKECLKIDSNAVIISDQHKRGEQAVHLQQKIGSTLSGTGLAVVERVMRADNVLMAKDVPELAEYVCDTKRYLRALLDQGRHVVIEGTQGFGLSNYHAKCYPYATSRDTTAAGFLAETGLSPFDVEHVVMVIRSFPIRVAGNSGPLEDEIDWETIARESGSEEYFDEKTTVTNRVRRVARFTPDIVKEAILVNQPDVIVLNHMDYIDIDNKDEKTLSDKQKKFLKETEQRIGRKIAYCGNGEKSILLVGDIGQ